VIDANGKLFIDEPEYFLDQVLVESQMNEILTDGINQIVGKLSGKSDDRTGNSASLSIEGYVKIESDGIRLIGSTTYQGRESRPFVAALPLVSDLQENIVFSHVASDDVYFTEIAIANPGNSGAAVNLELHNSEGAVMDSVTVSIPARQQQCYALTDYFSSIQGVNQTGGYVILSSNVPVAAISFFGTHSQSVLSAIPGQPVE
jgi:hypothetical protein